MNPNRKEWIGRLKGVSSDELNPGGHDALSPPNEHFPFFASILLCRHLTPSFCVCVCVFVTLLPWRQAFASKLHYHVVIEYIGQLMKSNYSCKNRKHEKAATKIHHQWNKLSDLFEDMVIKSSLPYQH